MGRIEDVTTKVTTHRINKILEEFVHTLVGIEDNNPT